MMFVQADHTIRASAKPAEPLISLIRHLDVRPKRVQDSAQIRKAPGWVHPRHAQSRQPFHQRPRIGKALRKTLFRPVLRIHPQHEMLSADIERSPHLNNASHNQHLAPSLAHVQCQSPHWIIRATTTPFSIISIDESDLTVAGPNPSPGNLSPRPGTIKSDFPLSDVRCQCKVHPGARCQQKTCN